jgi:DNA polymerase-3 subunit gamma/tau
VAEQDGIVIEERSLAALARASEGSMRDGLSLLDQAVAFGGKSIVHAELETLLGAVPQELLRALIRAMTSQDSAAALRTLSQLVEGGHDLRAYCADIVEYLRHLLVASVTPPQEWSALIEASTDDLAQLAADKASLTPEQIQQLFTMFTQAEDALRFSAHPRFVLETAAVKATRLLRQEMMSGEQPARASSGGPPQPAAARTEQTPPSTRPASTPVPRSSAPSDGAPAQAPTAVKGTRLAIRLDWEQFQDEVGQKFPNVAPFLEAGRLVSIEGNMVTIGFQKQATVARAMLEKADNIEALAALCERLCGQPVRLRVVELTDKDPPGPTMAQIRAAKEQEQKFVLLERAKAHPVVKQALEIFGAELADVRMVSNQQEVQE